jgi:hypothetical protein
MDEQKDPQSQNRATDEIRGRWEDGESIGLLDIARALDCPLCDAWGEFQKIIGGQK